jgi:hypothetical protein
MAPACLFSMGRCNSSAKVEQQAFFLAGEEIAEL